MHQSQNLRTDQKNRKIMTILAEKKERLMSLLGQFPALAVAFSGGVDSSFLLASAYKVLGENILAVTAESPIHPKREIRSAIAFAEKLGVRLVRFRSDEMNIPEFTANSKQRCYICKKHLFERIAEIATQSGIYHIAHGANMDDLNEFRPGFKAAEEMGIFAPMIEAGLSKSDIRALSREMGLDTHNKPAMACLATRIPYDVPISLHRLNMIENAEEVLYSLGIRGSRVRHHESLARIEVMPEDFDAVLTHRNHIVGQFKIIGFSYVSLDMEGYKPPAYHPTPSIFASQSGHLPSLM